MAKPTKKARKAPAPPKPPPGSRIKDENGLTYQQESFAQLVASGRSQADAYRAAYPASQAWLLESLYPRASELAADSKVAARIRFLRAHIRQQAIDDAVADKAWVLKRLKTVAERCLQSAPVLDRKGNPVLVETAEGGEMAVAFTFDPQGANRALELLGKEDGMFVDRKEVGEPGSFDKLDDDELSRAADEADKVIADARSSSRTDSQSRNRSGDKASRAKT